MILINPHIVNTWIKEGQWIYWRYKWESEQHLNKSKVNHVSKDTYGYVLEVDDRVFSYILPENEIYFRIRY